ncbi:MAG: PaaI family thioesterase [Phycisphaerales bacterium JB038]
MRSDAKSATTLEAVRRVQHTRCFVCASQPPNGLGVEYLPRGDGAVEATVPCLKLWEGYKGLVHGGIVAALLDGAMTNCLFARGVVAVTADMQVRFRHPLHIGASAFIEARITRQSGPLFVLRGAISQEGQVKATAVAKFMRCPPAPTNGDLT